MHQSPGFSMALAGGGTGGHVVPGLHLLSHFQRGGDLADVLWFGAGRPVEERVLAGAEERLRPARLERVHLRLEPPGGGAPSLARLVLRSAPETRRARAALRRHGSRVLLGLGGFTSLPAVLAARSLGIPVALLEINAKPGKATRTLRPLARRVFHAWPDTVKDGRDLHTGPPLAPAFLAGAPSDGESRAARAALGFGAEAPLLVVLGGSQGAGALNGFLAAHGPRLAAGGLQLLHQVGPGRAAEAAPAAPGYRAVEYVEDVVGALRAATLVLCRGGASTVAEVGALGRPALVVPYPHAPDRHQEHNARQLGAGARIVDEAALDGAFAAELLRLAGPPGEEERRRMAAALVRAVPADAGRRIAAELRALAG